MHFSCEDTVEWNLKFKRIHFCLTRKLLTLHLPKHMTSIARKVFKKQINYVCFKFLHVRYFFFFFFLQILFNLLAFCCHSFSLYPLVCAVLLDPTRFPYNFSSSLKFWSDKVWICWVKNPVLLVELKKTHQIYNLVYTVFGQALPDLNDNSV